MRFAIHFDGEFHKSTGEVQHVRAYGVLSAEMVSMPVGCSEMLPQNDFAFRHPAAKGSGERL
jgi:hypothetical protein